jgi:menaquinol-cytochrome c reductase iron-sulfur subunit
MSQSPPTKSPRRGFLVYLGLALNGLAALLIGVPVVRYFLKPARKQGPDTDQAWVTLGSLTSFPEGETRLAHFQNPFHQAWDGTTDDIPCWVRHVRGGTFQVFAINCAHLGCPVHWFPQSGLFLCPCHGGAYYEDGSRAAGPPPRGLYEYRHKVEGGSLAIFAGRLPTLSRSACNSPPPPSSPSSPSESPPRKHLPCV